MIDWLFEIGSLKLACKDTTYGGNSYTGAVISDSFSGITVRWDMSGSGLMAPGDLEFDISNADGDYTASAISGSECTVRLTEDGTQIRAWKFRIEHAVEAYGKISCSCVDFLSGYLSGDYPNTPAPTEVWASDSDDTGGDYCIPVTFGVAYIPVKSVNTGSDRYYVLGASGPTYTIHEVSTPHDWPSSTWDAASYDMDGYASGGYQLLQPIIMDSDGDDVADACGLWISGRSFLDMPCRFERNDTVSLTGPEEVVEYVLEGFGVPSGDIGSTSFTAAGVVYTGESVGFDGGGWWEKTSREAVLSELLAHVDSYLSITDKVELYQFSATPVETITSALSLSFKPQPITPVETDSGRVHWPESYTKPMDILSGQTIVPTHSGGSEDNPSSTVLECRFFPGDAVNAQKAGILYFQKKYEQAQRVSLSTVLTELTTKATLRPGQVVTVNNNLYGGSNSVVITEMTIGHDLKTDISGVIMNHLEDWGDLTTSSISITADTSIGERLATTDAQGNIAATWSKLIDIPDRYTETATLGLNLTDTHLGYFDGTDWQNYFDASANARIGQPDTGQGIAWNQSTGACTLKGSLTIENPSSVQTQLSLGDMAYESSVEAAKLGSTIIDGGYIKGELLDVSDIIVSGSIMVQGDSAYDTARVAGVDATTVKNNAANGATFTSASAGNLAYLNAVGNTQITDVSAGKITTGRLVAANSDVYLDLDTSVFHMAANSRIYFGNTTPSIGIISSAIWLSFGSNGFSVNAAASEMTANSKKIAFNGSALSPTTTTGPPDLGTTTFRFVGVYCHLVNTIGGNTYYDIFEDDMAVLHAIRPDANGNIDKFSLPEEVLVFDPARQQLRDDWGDMAPDEDIETMIRDENQAGWMVGVNQGELLALTIGAARHSDTLHWEERTEHMGWTASLDRRLKAVEPIVEMTTEHIEWTADIDHRLKTIEAALAA